MLPCSAVWPRCSSFGLAPRGSMKRLGLSGTFSVVVLLSAPVACSSSTGSVCLALFFGMALPLFTAFGAGAALPTETGLSVAFFFGSATFLATGAAGFLGAAFFAEAGFTDLFTIAGLVTFFVLFFAAAFFAGAADLLLARTADVALPLADTFFLVAMFGVFRKEPIAMPSVTGFAKRRVDQGLAIRGTVF